MQALEVVRRKKEAFREPRFRTFQQYSSKRAGHCHDTDSIWWSILLVRCNHDGRSGKYNIRTLLLILWWSSACALSPFNGSTCVLSPFNGSACALLPFHGIISSIVFNMNPFPIRIKLVSELISHHHADTQHPTGDSEKWERENFGGAKKKWWHSEPWGTLRKCYPSPWRRLLGKCWYWMFRWCSNE